MRRYLQAAPAYAVLLFVFAGCGGGGGTGPVTPTPSAPTVVSLSVTPAAVSVQAGAAAAQFTATATMSNASTQAVTAQAAWTSSNIQVATVAASGAATPLSAGDADIRATYQGATATARLTVTPGAPPTPSISGRVRDRATSAAISGATVIVKDTALSTVSDAAGNYAFSGLAPGNYVLRATKSGYDLTEVPVSFGASVTVDIPMPASASGPVAAFIVIPEPGTIATGEQCEVAQETVSGSLVNRLKCTFDASGSSAPGGALGYTWSFPVPNQPNRIFPGSPLVRPTLPCGSFPGTTDREVTLTISHTGGTTSITRMVTYRRNGPC